MTMPKPAVDFHGLDLQLGWEPAPGAAPGVEQKLLSGVLDEKAGVGVRTRLVRFRPGATVPDQFVHEYWEEVYLIDGAIEVGGTLYEPPSYACRPPGTPHGPFHSKDGCLFLEFQYFV
ncbi:MAG: cupin [Alphaproteobacteria bacterium]|nr:cupin [Alphaproteobacteria bacterium]